MTKKSNSVSFRSSRKTSGRNSSRRNEQERRTRSEERRTRDSQYQADTDRQSGLLYGDDRQAGSDYYYSQPDSDQSFYGRESGRSRSDQTRPRQTSSRNRDPGYSRPDYQRTRGDQARTRRDQTRTRSSQGRPRPEYRRTGGSQARPRRNPGRPVKNRRSTPKTGCLIFALIPLILIAVLITFTYKSFKKVEKHKLDQEAIAQVTQDRNMKKYKMIALFGVDDQNNVINDIGSRTDSIILACINKRTKQVKLMSIYRDTYVSIDGDYDKINAAYSYGGPEQALNTINRNLDLNIQDFATVNFKALADAVDILGGIELTIESEDELENLNNYIHNMNNINGGDSPGFDDTGTYVFDGNQAVAYSRIRYFAGGDHARASHQRMVVEGILQKAKKQPWKLKAIIKTVFPQCKTSLSTGDLTRLSLGILFYDIKDSQAYPFDSFDQRYEGTWYGFPTTVESNVIKAHKYLFGTKDYEPTKELKKISKKVSSVADELEPPD